MLIEIPVAWVDLDDMGAGAILQRLRALQVPDPVINDFFFYYQPDQRLYDTKQEKRTEQFTDVLNSLATTGARLMVIDAFNPMLSLHGLDPNSTPDIETFWREIADPIAKQAPAPTLLDHVAKNAETRGKYSYGSERKASGSTVHIGAHTLEALTIGGEGRAVLTVHKDRPAYLPRPTLGILNTDPVPTPSNPVQKPGLFGTSTTPSTSPPPKGGRGGRSHDAPMDGVTENDRVHHHQNGHDGVLPLELVQPDEPIPAGLFNDSEPDTDVDLPAELQPQETT
jgi:hypothetical protein